MSPVKGIVRGFNALGFSLSHAHTQTYTHPSYHTCSSGNTGYIQRGLLYALWEEEEAGTLYT